MTTVLQSTHPVRSVSVPWYTGLPALPAPGESMPRPRCAGLPHVGYALGVLLAYLLLMTAPVWAEGKPALPGGVPNLLDPIVRAQYKPTFMGNRVANPDFHVVLLVNTTGIHPGAVLVALDARNGTDTWSCSTDPIVLIAPFADPATITDAYIDRGLREQGTPSGSFQNVPDPRQMLPDFLHALSEPPLVPSCERREGSNSRRAPGSRNCGHISHDLEVPRIRGCPARFWGGKG